MVRAVVHVVEVEVGRELRVGRAGEKVQAAVESQDGVALLDDGGNRREHEDVVISRAAGDFFELFDGVFAGVQIDQPHAVPCRVLDRIDRRRAVQPRLIDVGHDQQAGTAVAVDRIVDRAQTHRAGAGEDRHVAALADAHFVRVDARLRVIHRVEGADDAAQRLRQRAVEVFLCAVLQQAVLLHDFGNQDGVLRIAAAVFKGVAWRHLRAVVSDGGLNDELLAGRELVCPLCADLFDDAAEFMADDRGVLGNVVRHALVVRALDGRLVAGHADGVGNDLDENFVVADLRKFKCVEAQVVLRMHAHRFVGHGSSS